MKKFLSILIVSAVLSGSVFANFFSNRIFEFGINAPVGLSNNTFAIFDYLKEDLVIDLNEMVKKMPENGFNISFNVNPSISANLYLPVFDICIKSGIEGSGTFGISKDLFEFICTGNELGEEIKVEGKVSSDIFAYTEAKVSFHVKDFDVTIVPTLFMPVAHVFSNGIGVTFQNTEGGDVIADVNGALNVYANANLDSLDASQITANLLNSFGFDLGGAVSYRLFDLIDLTGYIRMPIVAGRFAYANQSAVSMHYVTNIKTLTSGEPSEENQGFQFTSGEWNSTDYKINRPFKINASAAIQPLGSLLNLKGLFGFAVKNPFSDVEGEALVYPEYYLGATVSLFDIIKTSISSEYTDQIFKQQLVFVANVRFIELDTGVSFQSSNFESSFRAAGFGAFVTFIMGL